MSIKITAEIFENVVLNSDKPVLVDFWQHGVVLAK